MTALKEIPAPQKIPDKQFQEAVESVKELCAGFFKKFPQTPDRLFCKHPNGQYEDVLHSYGFRAYDINMVYDHMTYDFVKVEINSIRMDEALNSQDRRDLDKWLIREITMQSFQTNGNDIDAPAAILLLNPDGTYTVGDARHRIIWSKANGCKDVMAYVVRCNDPEIWNGLREKFNNMLGAERSQEERLFLVYRKYIQGGHGSIRDLCEKNGVSETRFNEFREQQKISTVAKNNGLKVARNTPPEIVKIANQAILKGLTLENAQKLVDGITPANSRPIKISASVTKDIQNILKEEGNSPEAVEKAAATVRESVGRAKLKRGPNKNHRVKFMEGIDIASKNATGGNPSEIGMPKAEIENYLGKVNVILNWLNLGLEAIEEQ